jgi:5-methylcytosine-specific restriction protein A
MRTHPWCEKCLKEGKYSPARDCHHIISPFAGNISNERKYALLTDVNNFIALCRECHNEIHQAQEKTKKDKHKQQI